VSDTTATSAARVRACARARTPVQGSRAKDRGARTIGWIIVVVLGSTLFAPPPAAAQKNPGPTPRPPERHFRVALGVAAGTAGLGGAVDLSMDTQGRVYRGRLTFHDNAIGDMGSGRERLTLFETAIMVGRGRRFTRNYGSLAAGLALVTLDEHGDGGSKATVGVPLEAQLISGGPLRLGATLMGNLNLERPVAAFILSVQLGRVP
jgi:hypothetical protein